MNVNMQTEPAILIGLMTEAFIAAVNLVAYFGVGLEASIQNVIVTLVIPLVATLVQAIKTRNRVWAPASVEALQAQIAEGK